MRETWELQLLDVSKAIPPVLVKATRDEEVTPKQRAELISSISSIAVQRCQVKKKQNPDGTSNKSNGGLFAIFAHLRIDLKSCIVEAMLLGIPMAVNERRWTL